MKKMIVALVAMVMMTMSVNAQSSENRMTFDRLSSYLELTSDQIEPVKTALVQFDASMQSLYNLKDASKGYEAWEKIQARHMGTMKEILTEKQLAKYKQTFELTAKNTAERLAGQDTAKN